jgi:penicillin amidase
MLELLGQPTNAWWDDRRTRDVVEDRDATVARSLTSAYDSLVSRYGSPARGAWRWDRIASLDIHHLLRLPGFSALGIRVAGGGGTLNPAAGSGGFGPSWRLVVDLGPEIKAWGTYPGGQSGNPASARYDDRIPKWIAGDLEPLAVPANAQALPDGSVMATLTLTPRGP